MNKFVIDAYAWVEYLDGSILGETIAEVASHFKRKKKIFDESKRGMFSLTHVLGISPDFAQRAGELHGEIKLTRKNMNLIDAFVLCSAQSIGGKVVTSDEDFRGLKEVVMIK